MQYTARTTIEANNVKIFAGDLVPDDFLTEEEIALFVEQGVIEPGYLEVAEVYEVTSADSINSGDTRV